MLPPREPQLRRIVLAGQETEYRLRHSARRSIALSIDRHGLRVSAPLRTSLKDIEQLLRKHADWVVEKLAQRANRPMPSLPGDGERLPLLGGEITLNHHPAGRSAWRFNGDTLELHLADAAHIPALLKAALSDAGRNFFRQRLEHYAPLLGLSPPPLRISSARTRWGSCSSRGSISLSWRLAMLAPELVDYVICHELAHLKEMNHSPRFWAIVEQLCPNWQSLRATLRQQGRLIPDF